MKSIFFFICLLTAVSSVCAQNKKSFNTGDQFLIETTTNTSSFFQRGDQILETGTRLYITQLFTIIATSEEGYTITATTTKLIDTVDALGGEARYHSGLMADSLSVVEKAIKNLLAVKDTILISKSGMVLSTTSNDIVSQLNDKVLPFTGIMPVRFIRGSVITPFSDFSHVSTEKGFKWTDTANSQLAKSVIKYNILSVQNNYTTVAFTAETSGAYANTNTNGVDFIDNNNGLVLERHTQNITLENKILNGVLFSIQSRSAVSRHCTFLPAEN